MHSAVVSRGAGDCHGHDVISRLLSDVMRCSPGLWWTWLAVFGTQVVLYAHHLFSLYHRHLFLSITDFARIDARSSDCVIDGGQGALKVHIQWQVGAEEVIIENMSYRLMRIFKPVTDELASGSVNLIYWARVMLHTPSRTLACSSLRISAARSIVALDNNHLVGFVLMWWQRLKAALRNMTGTYRPCESPATIRKIAWMPALLIQSGDGKKKPFWVDLYVAALWWDTHKRAVTSEGWRWTEVFLFSGEEEREVTGVTCWQWTGVKRSWCVLTLFVSRDGESAQVICLSRGAEIGLHNMPENNHIIVVLTDTTIGIWFTITGDD